jgi:5-methylcytosine-specific restriction endonuclease McrA
MTARFEDDHCANCFEELRGDVLALFCGELCRQTAELVRYWRRAERDGRINQPDVREAIRTRMAHVLAGGYDTEGRRLPPAVREQVWERDGGKCRTCGQAGEEIDHIRDSSPDLENLQLLCKDCHREKTQARMVPAPPEKQAYADWLRVERVLPDEPALLCDDTERWATLQGKLRKERRARLADAGGYGEGVSPREAALYIDALGEQLGGHHPDDDSGFGPYSYFAHAMNKDD